MAWAKGIGASKDGTFRIAPLCAYAMESAINLPAASGFIKPDLLNGRPVQGWCAARGPS
jgi:hypothetical protein